MSLIDTHCHLTDPLFYEDVDGVIAAADKAGVTQMITVGTDIPTSINAVEMAAKYPEVYAAVGIHPTEILSTKIQDPNNFQHLIFKSMNELEKLLQEPKVVALGEIGLDKHAEPSEVEYERQKELFLAQITLAKTYRKPIIIHSWAVKDDVLTIMPKGVQGVFHCYEGSKKYLKRILDYGFYVSFTGNITYAADRLAVAAEVPLNRLLLETDSPLMTPLPFRGTRNEPVNVRLIAEAHAGSRGIGVEEVVQATSQNARRLFKL
jgi:TatD DNase family protein